MRCNLVQAAGCHMRVKASESSKWEWLRVPLIVYLMSLSRLLPAVWWSRPSYDCHPMLVRYAGHACASSDGKVDVGTERPECSRGGD